MNSIIKKFTICFAAVISALSMTLTTTAEMTLSAAADTTLTDEADDNEAESRSASNIRFLQQRYPSGSIYNDKFDGATQCMGFAYYCYYMYNDDHVNETIPDSKDSNDYYSLATDSSLKKFLRKAGAQCYVRGKTKSGAVHSIFIVGYSISDNGDNKVTVYDCNMNGENGVLLDEYSYDEFRKHMNSVLFCYTSDGVFYDHNDF